MKTVDFPSFTPPTLPETPGIAQNELVILRTASGHEFLVGVIDEFQKETDALSTGTVFQELLGQRAKESGTIPFEAIRSTLS